MTLTYTQKKYLFAIYKLWKSGGEVKSAEVAKAVGVSKASTVTMTQKLCESGYIKKEHYGQIMLTEKGINETSDVFAKYLIINNFLLKSLNIDKKKAATDAAAIISHISEETAEKLSKYFYSDD